MTSASAAATTSASRRPLPAMLISAVIGLGLGYLVLELVNYGIRLLWETIPQSWETTPAWYVIGLLMIAAALVYVIRRFVGDHGHSPIGGIAVSPLTPKQYVGAILAILASLWGGIVLGPEVALVATGSVVGTVMASVFKITDPKDVKKVVGLGALGGILALFLGPILAGTMELGSTPTAIEVDQLGWAIIVAAIATVAVTLARLVAALLARAAGDGPHLVTLLASALIIGVAAILLHSLTGEPVIYVTTSGEELISALPQLTSVSTVAAIIVFKTIAYAVSLGSGFRGGPFFPAMFVGAASGLLISLLMGDSGPSVPAAIVVGVVASVIATAPMKWPIAIVLGIAIGFAMGTWTLVPAALIAAVVARLIPRWGDRITLTAHAG